MKAFTGGLVHEAGLVAVRRRPRPPAWPPAHRADLYRSRRSRRRGRGAGPSTSAPRVSRRGRGAAGDRRAAPVRRRGRFSRPEGPKARFHAHARCAGRTGGREAGVVLPKGGSAVNRTNSSVTRNNSAVKPNNVVPFDPSIRAALARRGAPDKAHAPLTA